MKKIVTIFLCILFSVCYGFSQNNEKAYTPVVSQAGYSDISLPLIDIGPIPPKGASGHHQHKSVMPERPSQDKTFKNRESALPNGDDPAMQKGKTQTDVTIPVRVFDGIENPDNGSSYFTDWVYPSDANGDIGPNHYVQMCNTIFEIFDREGNSLFGPADNATIWDGFVGDWTGTNDGDPIVLYDERADRWLVSQFAVETEITGGTYWILVAVSSTSNPLGSYYRYAFEFESFPDYPKFGIWEDGYYLSVQHGNGTATAAVLNRDQMLSGTVYPQYIYFNVPNLPGLGFVGMLPADCDGQWPPAGLPNYFIYFSDDAWGDDPVDCLKLWKLQVNWNEPVASTFVLAQTINTAAFDSDFGGFGTEVIPQPGTDQGLDAMSLAMMNRLQFRTFGYYYSMVCCHTVDVDNNDRAGIRWYELRKTNGDWYIYQQSTFAPNSSENFWMGSIAQNGYGDMALGYSVSGSSTFPSLRCTGRNYADPTNQMTYGDMELQQGQSSQIGIDRWGDYCSMNIDPVDHNTFWFTSQYIQNNSNPSTWGTSIAAIGLREYCTAQGGCDEYISNVVRGIQNNISGCTGYADYTNLSTNLVLNMTLDITVHNGNPYAPDQCGIWVDWNRDGDFIDADENIAVSGNPGLGPYDATLQPPDGTSTGPCIMRTRIIYTGTLDPCGSTTYGEVEDYTINVTAAAPNTWIGAISQNWSNPANWSLGHVPYATEDVLITTTGYHPVILDLPLVPCNNLMVQNDASILFFNNGISVQNNAIINGNIYFNGTLCTLHVYKDISWESGSSATINGHGTFFVYGNWTFKPGANVDLSGCTTSFAGFTYQSNIYNLSENCAFGDLVSEKIAPQGLVIAQSSNDILVNGELQSWSQIPLTMESSNQLIVKGDIIIYWASGLNLNSGSLVLQGNNQLLKMNDGQVFNDLTIESQGTVSFADNGFNSFTVNGYLSINSGVFDITGKTVNIFQGWLNSAGPDALIEENSTVIFKGSGYTYCSSEEFDNIEMNSAPGVVVQILDNDFVSCNSYNYTSGGGIETSGTGAGFTAYDLADPGIYGIFRAANGSVINLYQDDASYVDLNGSLFIEGGEIYIHGGLGDCWWPYQGNGSLFMTDGILDFTEAGIYLYDSPSYTLSTAIYGGTIRTTGNFLGYRDDFNPTGGTMGLYGNADVQCVLNDGSNFFDLKIDKATEKGQDISQQKTHMEYRDGSKKPINRNNQVTMSGDIWIAGDFILNSGVVTAPDKISISGDWTNVPGPDAFIEGNGQVVFTGNTDHQYCSTEEFYTLEIDKTAGDLFVASDADIRCMTLVFTQGQVEMHGGMFTAWDLFQNGVYGSYYLDGGTINLYQISGLTGLNGDLVVVNGYFNVFGTEIISSWPDYQDASIFMTGGVINFNTGGIFIHETAFEKLTANITGGTIVTSGDFLVNVDDFQPQNLTLELDGPGDADILIAGNNHVQDIVIYKFPPTGPTDNQLGTGAFDPDYAQAVTGERELNGIVTAIGNVNITNNLEIEAGSFDVSQYHVSVANEINIDYFGTLIMNHPSGKLECEILNWMENSKDEITAGEIYCYNWNFYEYTLAQLGPGNTAYVTGWPYQEEVDASFGNLVLGPENPGKNYEGVGGNKIVTSGYFKIRSSVYLFDNPIEVGTDLIIEEPAILGIVSPGYIIVGWDLNLKGILQVFSGLVQVHGNFDFPDGAILDNAGTVRFDRPLGSYFELSGHLMMEEPESILEFTHHGVTIMPSFIGSINDGTIRVGSDFVASIMGTFTPQGGTLELLPHLEPGHPDPPYLWLANGNHLHNLTVNANTSAYLLQSHFYLKGDLTINSGELWAHLGNIEIEGNWTNNVANSFYPGSKTVSFIGDGISEIFTNEKFNNLTIYKTGASTEDVRIATGKNIQVESDLLITNGTLELNSSATLDIGKDLTLNSGAGLNAGGDDVLVEINIAGNWTDNNTSSNATTGFFPGTSTVVFDGTINQEVISGGAGETFYNLEIDKSSGNFTPSTNLVILNDLLVQNGLFYNLVSRSHQLHRNLSIQPGGQLLPYGTFTFAGSPVASFQDLGTATSFFENVIVNKESELNLLSQMTLLNGRDLLVQNGTLFVNGTNLGVSGDVLIEDDGILSMDLGSILEVGAGQVLDIDGGGLLEIIGSASEPCIITHFDDGFYEFNINGGGTISAENTIFEYVGQRYGVYLHPDAIVDPVHSFHECTFRNGDLQVQDAAFISFENDQEITVNDAVFVSGSVPYNVSKENGMGHVTFVNATGDLAGDAFENDPAGLIDWMGGNTLQSINLPQGWSGLSAFVQPDPDDIEMIFDPIVSDLTILQNNAGMYYPGQSINTIGPWASQAAFKIKMLNETMLDVFGSFEMNQTYPFMQGWNLIPVICNAPVDAQALFSTADLIVAKEVAGTGILWPEYGINTLNSLLPGRAYYALAGSAGSIQFPAYAKDNSQIVNTQQVLPAHPWNEIWTTPSSHLIAITSGATENLLQGDVIGVFSQNDNRCYGVTEIADPASGLALTAFADDPETSAKDGLMAGDVFRLELFRPGTMQFFDLVPIFDHSLPNGPEFENEGLSSIIQLKLSPTGIAGDASTGIRIYPNPTDGEFWVEGISGMSEIEITNVLGETIGSYLLESHNRIKIDVSDFQAGIYQVKVVGDKGTVLRKVIKK